MIEPGELLFLFIIGIVCYLGYIIHRDHENFKKGMRIGKFVYQNREMIGTFLDKGPSSLISLASKTLSENSTGLSTVSHLGKFLSIEVQSGGSTKFILVKSSTEDSLGTLGTEIYGYKDDKKIRLTLYEDLKVKFSPNDLELDRIEITFLDKQEIYEDDDIIEWPPKTDFNF